MAETNMTEAAADQILNTEQAEEAAKRQQFGHTEGLIDHTIGGQGGAGASATGPDIAKQSKPQIGNHSDLPAGQR